MKKLSKVAFLSVLVFAFSCSKENETTVSTDNAKTTETSFAKAGVSKKFLFDATKAETAGNADWVIDADASPQRFPTPLQATITAATTESFWKGGISSWGIALVKQGHSVETLPSGTAITFGTAAAQDLKNFDVYVVDEPNTKFTASEKTAILNFVKNGGGLFMISDHNISDRNGDGFDSVAVWNDLMTTNTVQTNPFGFKIDLTNYSQTTTNVLTAAATNTILNGPLGAVTNLKFSAGASLTTNTATAKGLIWKTGSPQSTTNVMCASSTFGTGRVFVICDSSPADDGSGAPGDNLFPGWTELVSHSRLHMNASLWLAKL